MWCLSSLVVVVVAFSPLLLLFLLLLLLSVNNSKDNTKSSARWSSHWRIADILWQSSYLLPLSSTVYPLPIHTCNLCHSIDERATSCGRKEAAEGTKHNTQHWMTHKRQKEGRGQGGWAQAAKRQTSIVDRHFVNAIFGFIDWINTYLS